MASKTELLQEFSEETIVGFDNHGKPIKAGQLQCWVYELLEELAEQAKA